MTSALGRLPRRIHKLGMAGLVAPRGTAALEGPLKRTVTLGGVGVDLMSRQDALAVIMERAAGGAAPLGVLSANRATASARRLA